MERDKGEREPGAGSPSMHIGRTHGPGNDEPLPLESQVGFVHRGGGLPDQRSDRQLFDAARRGDAGAFAAVYLRYGSWLLELARRWTSSEDVAHDVRQDSFLCLLSSLPNLELHGPLPRYLVRVAWSCFLMRRRTESRRTRREQERAREREDHLPRRLAGPDIQGLIESLTPCDREVIVHHYMEERTIAETAELLRLPEGTVKSRLNHGLRALREKLDSDRTGEGGCGIYSAEAQQDAHGPVANAR